MSAKLLPGDLALFYGTLPALVALKRADYYDDADDELCVFRAQIKRTGAGEQLTHGFFETWRDAAIREARLVARPGP